MDIILVLDVIFFITFGVIYISDPNCKVIKNALLISLIVIAISALALIPKKVISEKFVTDNFYIYDDNSIVITFDKPVEIVKTITKSRFGFEYFKTEEFSIKTEIGK